MELLFDGRLNKYLHEVDEECYEMLEQFVEQMKEKQGVTKQPKHWDQWFEYKNMKEKQGVTKQLKVENQMLWVGKMNNIIACAEEIVVRKVVYGW